MSFEKERPEQKFVKREEKDAQNPTSLQTNLKTPLAEPRAYLFKLQI